MAVLTAKRWSLRNRVCLCAVAVLCLMYYVSLPKSGPELDLTRRDAILQYIENKLKEELKTDKGTGCEIPVLDPFSKDVTKFEKDVPKIQCDGQDWVKCYHSECKVVDGIKETVKDITCVYRDILFRTDLKNILGPPSISEGYYKLTASDYATVSCTGVAISNKTQLKWSGNVLGFRSRVDLKTPPPGREGSLNVLIFAFDSAARNGFIRRMPKSWKVLTEELGAIVMEGYNIVGDGTAAALFPILTGKTELELPDVRKSSSSGATLDACPFIFYELKGDGYRTAYFEDAPDIGTFQYKYKGFRNPPADHYLRAFFVEEQKNKDKRLWQDKRGNLTFHYNVEDLKDRAFLYGPHTLQNLFLEKAKERLLDGRKTYCVGETPQYKLMIDITEQFMALEGKRFAFTLTVDITHNDFNMAQSADEDTAAFLRGFRRHREDTLLVVMGDHGPRFAKFRNTVQGKLEERLPLMALLLPHKLVQSRPQAEAALRGNARVLTTPHDLHATLLDVLRMTQHANTYRVQGADLKRGLSMLEPIPRNRSCSEAGVEPHWCACLVWQNVSASDPVYDRAAHELLRLINTLLREAGSKCVRRTLTSVEWVLRQRPNGRLLSFVHATNFNLGRFGGETKNTKENYQIKVVLGPGRAVFEASLTYVVSEDLFHIHPRDISRTNAYGNEPHCISNTLPHLNFYCYCRH